MNISAFWEIKPIINDPLAVFVDCSLAAVMVVLIVIFFFLFTDTAFLKLKNFIEIFVNNCALVIREVLDLHCFISGYGPGEKCGENVSEKVAHLKVVEISKI